MKSYEKASQEDKRWQGSSFNFSGLKKPKLYLMHRLYTRNKLRQDKLKLLTIIHRKMLETGYRCPVACVFTSPEGEVYVVNMQSRGRALAKIVMKSSNLIHRKAC